ncbi:cell wall hydrolase [Novosphingobium sp.]|uniref:cell wall hydrolase n=1 Tax=Novosphingobium sp. TaxID=1874826 RepID=UPI002FE202F0
MSFRGKLIFFSAVVLTATSMASAAAISNGIEEGKRSEDAALPTVQTAPSDDAPASDTALASQADLDDPELICMAKVVRHEAANQPRSGQLAVAQLIMNRVRSPKFPKSVCGVVNQPGQFFSTGSYNPARGTEMWKTAVDVSVEAMRGEGRSPIGEAIYYNGSGSPSAFHKSRKFAAVVGDHTFYY